MHARFAAMASRGAPKIVRQLRVLFPGITIIAIKTVARLKAQHDFFSRVEQEKNGDKVGGTETMRVGKAVQEYTFRNITIFLAYLQISFTYPGNVLLPIWKGPLCLNQPPVLFSDSPLIQLRYCLCYY